MSRLLELREVVKRFGGVNALGGVNLNVGTGEIRALIGPNGSGKSTCLNVISGIYSPTSGEVRFKGQSLNGLPPHQITRLGLARTFQNIRLFKRLTALENVMVAAEVHSRDPIIAALWPGSSTRRAERVAREEAGRALALVGLEEIAGSQAGSLPYGKQRLVEIARALASRPELILLDEPAAGMNPEETRSLMDQILRIRAAGIAILLVEHKMDLVMKIADRITVLDFGEPIAEGTPDEVSADPKVVEAYLGRTADRKGAGTP